MNDIEKYLADEMNAEERAAFEAELERNPALAKEVNFIRQLTEDIETAALDERVKAATKGLLPVRSKKSTYVWWSAFALAGLLIVAMFIFQKDKTTPQQMVVPPVKTPTTDSLRLMPPKVETGQPSSPKAAEEKTKGRPNRPIAQNQKDENRYISMNAPRLRGSNASLDSSGQVRLDAVWHTEYPPKALKLSETFRQVDGLLQQRDFSKSYARLQLLERKIPANDTLFFLKGYCLLEQGEGGEALRYFDQIKNKSLAGNDLLEWYHGLAFLLLGDDGNAKKIFTTISANPAHAFRQQAQQALKLFK